MTRHGTRLCVAVAAFGAAAALVPAPAGGQDSSLRITKPVHATKFDVDPNRTYSAPVLIAHPDDPLLVMASFVEMRSKRCGMMRSNDGGQTWKVLERFPGVDSYPFCFTANGSVLQTPLAWGRNNTLYYAFAGWDVQDNPRAGNTSVQLARTTNLGESWETVLVRNARGKQGDDQENNRPVQGLAVDTSGSQDTVYVAWRQDHRQPQSPNAVPEFPAIAVSRDGGRTFGEPVLLHQGVWTPERIQEALRTTTTVANPTTPPLTNTERPTNFGGGNPHVVLDDKGTVYVAWPSRATNITGGIGPAIFFSTSTDKGRTFTTQQITPFRFGNPGFGNIRMAWSPEGGEQGTIHMITEGTERPEVRSELDVFYRQSTDGGRSWTAPRLVNDDNPADFYFQFDPNISVAPNGRVDVTWWDTRHDPGITVNDVYYAYSTDNGVSWSKNIRITDQSVDRKVGVWLNNFNVDTQPGLLSNDDFVLFGWDDTRNTDRSVQTNLELGGGLQDIYTSALQFRAVSTGTSRVAKYVLAGVVGAAVVGLVLLGVALAQRRREGLPGGAPGRARTPEVPAR